MLLFWSSLLFSLCAAAEQDYLNSEVPGSVVSKLTEDTFDAFVKQGNSFVEFYAPWCGHCKHFARTWEEIGKEVQPKGIKVAKIDATSEKTTAGRYGVKGFPTLIFFRDGYAPREYKGPRTKEQVLRFCDRVISDAVVPATPTTHLTLLNNSAVTFALLCGSDCAKAKETLERAAYDFADQPVGFISIADAALIREYLPTFTGSISQLIRIRAGDAPLVFSGSLVGAAEPDATLADWLLRNHFPLVTQIKDGYAYSALSKHSNYVVVGIYANAKREPLQEMLERIARLRESTFAFGILEAEAWASFIDRRFGPGSYPRLVVLDGDNVHYEFKSKLDTSDAGDMAVLSFLEDVNWGRTQSDAREVYSAPYNFWQRLIRHGIVSAVKYHWMFLGLVIGGVSFLLWVFWLICKEPGRPEEDVPTTKTPKAGKEE